MSFLGSKGASLSLFKTTERFHLGRVLKLLGISLRKVGEQPTEFKVLRNMEPHWTRRSQ